MTTLQQGEWIAQVPPSMTEDPVLEIEDAYQTYLAMKHEAENPTLRISVVERIPQSSIQSKLEVGDLVTGIFDAVIWLLELPLNIVMRIAEVEISPGKRVQ